MVSPSATTPPSFLIRFKIDWLGLSMIHIESISGERLVSPQHQGNTNSISVSTYLPSASCHSLTKMQLLIPILCVCCSFLVPLLMAKAVHPARVFNESSYPSNHMPMVKGFQKVRQKFTRLVKSFCIE